MIITKLEQDVIEFHKKFKIQKQPNNPKMLHARILHLHEEVVEYANACSKKDKSKQLDALVDLIYVALGTVYLTLSNRNFREAWVRVHKANLNKIRKKTNRSEWDVVKPKGWKEPDLSDLT